MAGSFKAGRLPLRDVQGDQIFIMALQKTAITTTLVYGNKH